MAKTVDKKIRTLTVAVISLAVLFICATIISLTRPTQASPDPGTCLPVDKGGTGCDSTETVNFLKTDLVNTLYPVGSVMISTTSANPSTYLGGTWVAWGSGKVPVGVDTGQTEFNTVEKTGGDKNMQQHNHTFSGTSATSSSTTPTFSGTQVTSGSTTPTFSGTRAVSENTQPAFTGTAMGNHNHTQNQHRHQSSGYDTDTNLAFLVADRNMSVSYGVASWSSSADRIAPTVSLLGSSFTLSRNTSTNYATPTNVAASAGTPAGTVQNHSHTVTAAGTVSSHGHTVTAAGTVSSHSHSVTAAGTIENAGTGTAQNLQPYITCYMWKRTN